MRKLLVYILITGTITLAVNGVYLARQPERDEERMLDVPSGIQISNFGSSHGKYGFNYQDIDEEYCCFNFALSSQLPSYDLRIMKCYEDCLSEGGTVFLVMSFLSVFGPSDEQSNTFESRNLKYYSFLPAEYIKQYNAKTDFILRYFPSLISVGRLVSVLFQKEQENMWDRTAEQIDVSGHARDKYVSHIKDKTDGNGERIFNREEIQAVCEMIEICKRKSIRPVLITVPFMKEYTDTIRENDPGFFDDFYGVVEQIQADTGVEYYDYSMDERFIYDASLFFDSDHLNREGARQFTDTVLKEILHIAP